MDAAAGFTAAGHEQKVEALWARLAEEYPGRRSSRSRR